MAKAKRKKTTAASTSPPSLTTSKSVEVKRISNGYIVSTWGPKGQKEKFAKTKKDAKVIAGTML